MASSNVVYIFYSCHHQVDESELRAVVSSPSDKYYFHSSTFDKLKDLLMYQVIGKVACGGMYHLYIIYPHLYIIYPFIIYIINWPMITHNHLSSFVLAFLLYGL
jgi:hypothetical protein